MKIKESTIKTNNGKKSNTLKIRKNQLVFQLYWRNNWVLGTMTQSGLFSISVSVSNCHSNNRVLIKYNLNE